MFANPMKKALISLLMIIVIITGSYSIFSSNKIKKTINIGIDDSYPPLSFKVNKKDVSGFDVELLRAILENLGYKTNFITMKFEQIEDALINNKIDIAAGGFSKSDTRIKKFLFSDPYYEPNFCLIFKKLKNEIFSIKDIVPESKIGVQKNTIIEDYASNLLNQKPQLNYKIVFFDDNNSMLNALKKNEINYFIIENLQAELLMQNNKDISYIVLNSDQTDSKEIYAFGFNMRNKKFLKPFNSELRKFEESGKIDILKLRWFSNYSIYDKIIS